MKFLTGLLLLFLLHFPILALSGENKQSAKLPYDSLFKMQETMSVRSPQDQPILIRIFSSSPDVKNSTIILTLISKNESVEIPKDECGFIDLPMRKDLVGHGAFVVSNQPKGSLILRAESKAEISLTNKTISYLTLIKPILVVEQVQEIAKNTSGILSEKYKKSLNVIIEQESNKPVIVRISSKENINLFSDTNGNVSIPIEERLKKINPIVEFPSDKAFYAKAWN